MFELKCKCGNGSFGIVFAQEKIIDHSEYKSVDVLTSIRARKLIFICLSCEKEYMVRSPGGGDNQDNEMVAILKMKNEAQIRALELLC